jgi:hypothetical protein
MPGSSNWTKRGVEDLAEIARELPTLGGLPAHLPANIAGTGPTAACGRTTPELDAPTCTVG